MKVLIPEHFYFYIIFCIKGDTFSIMEMGNKSNFMIRRLPVLVM